MLALLLQACADPAPDEIRFAMGSAPSTLDPRYATDAASARVVRLLYQAPVDFDAAFNVIPQLTEVIRDSDRRYRLRIIGAPTFSDGRPLTASDIAATYRAVLDETMASPHSGSLAHIANIEVLDERTLVFDLARADLLFAGRLVVGVMPAEVATADATAFTAIGSGPFTLLARPHDGELLLQRRHDGQHLRLLTVKDPTVRALKLARGEVDILQGDLAPELLGWLARRDDIDIVADAGTTFSYIGINLQDPVLARHEVRQALAQAIDREALVRYLLQGHARLGNSVLVPAHWAVPADLPSFSYDPAAARALLASLGYDRELPLTLGYKTSTDPLRQRIAAVLQQQLAEVGIKLKIEANDFGTFYGDIIAGRFQLYGLSWVGLKLPDHFRYAFHSASAPPAGANRGRFVDYEVDRLLEAADAAPDEAAMVTLLGAAQRRIASQLPYLPLWYEDTVAAVSGRVTGYAVRGDGAWDSLVSVEPVAQVRTGTRLTATP
ncbi:MAG: ABC transporter substrate-binding protein [Gammaproteobacteria bacterium]|nr:ABC transporter substrate-binding protein [Gammaproteobacteria bacterium]